jgi:hypothetical protein
MPVGPPRRLGVAQTVERDRCRIDTGDRLECLVLGDDIPDVVIGIRTFVSDRSGAVQEHRNDVRVAFGAADDRRERLVHQRRCAR